MLNDTIRLGAQVRHVDRGHVATVIGHAAGEKCWLHLVEAKVRGETIQVWLGRSVLVEI